MIQPATTLLVVNLFGEGLKRLRLRRGPTESVSARFSDGQTVSLDPQATTDLESFVYSFEDTEGAPTQPSGFVLADGRTISVSRLVQLAAALRTRDVPSATVPEIDLHSLPVPEAPGPLIEAYLDILADEFPWAGSDDLRLVSEYFALRDDDGTSADDAEWADLTEDSSLLEAVLTPSMLPVQSRQT